ncbi:uncharacterized protein LOC133674030 [Populus nigra]|uniref:uncharacterized protein LOC133674030 n=1 Tax=Populus nigra TaxID=3691 RepID=UPI002B2733B1|nr:uncharacterized protein LOC133674030 [Populus nigra]
MRDWSQMFLMTLIEPPATPAMCVQSQPASNITPSFSEATASISFTQPTPTTIPALPATSSVSSQVTSSDAHQEFDKANLTGTKRRLDFHDESDQPRLSSKAQAISTTAPATNNVPHMQHHGDSPTHAKKGRTTTPSQLKVNLFCIYSHLFNDKKKSAGHWRLLSVVLGGSGHLLTCFVPRAARILALPDKMLFDLFCLSMEMF